MVTLGVKRKHFFILTAVLFTYLLPLYFTPLALGECLSQMVAGSEAFDIENLSENINYTKILNHVRNISKLGSRVTGYNGSIKTAEYIENTLRSYGLEVVRHQYKTIVPLDEGSSVIVLENDGTEVWYRAYAMWPNGIQTSPTPPEGLKGHLIYVETGELKFFEGKEVKDSIVLMEYDCGNNWLNAAKLGAKGVIFIASKEESTYTEALAKFIEAPLYFPRLLVNYETGLALKKAAEQGLSVIIHSRMYYREITASNIIGILPGSQSNDVIIVSSHYDTWAPAPLLANSPMEAISPAYLLELARVMSSTTPLRTVWFVFFSGHWQALSGAREFVEDYYFSPAVQNGTLRPLMLINIGDLDPLGSGLQVLRGGAGTLYGTVDVASGIAVRYGWVRSQLFTKYLHDPKLTSIIKNLTGSEPSNLVQEFFTNEMFWGTENYYYMLDSEPAEMTRGVSFTIQTAYTSKQWKGSNIKLPAGAISQLAPQLIIITHIVNSFINEPQWGLSWSETSPTRVFIQPGGFSQYSGFITLKGETLEYNLTNGWYTPVPHALVQVSLGIIIGTNYYPYPYPFNKYLTYSDENGRFEIHGLSPYPFIPSRYIVDAWVVNETSGKIIYAPDKGVYGAKVISPVASPITHPDKCSVVLMRVNTITLFDVFDPNRGTPGLLLDSRAPSIGQNGGLFYSKGCTVIPEDFDSKGEPLFYGVYYNGFESVALVFTLPSSRVMVMAKRGGVSRPLAYRPFLILVNASEKMPEGTGILAIGNSPSIYEGNALKYAQDIVLLTRKRYNDLSSREIRSLSAEEKLLKAEQYLKDALRFYRDKYYERAYVKALAAWAWGSKAYDEVMALYDDSGKTSLFFFALIILNAILLERLLIHASGKRQLIGILLIGAFALGLFGFVHPALTVMTNSTMAILGLLSLTLFTLTAGILADKTQRILKEVSYALMGYHVIESGRTELTSTAFSISIENMRRRKFRTVLVLINFITVSFALTSLTSISPYIGIKEVPWEIGAPSSYPSILVKNGFSLPTEDVLGPYTVDIIRGVVGEEGMVMPRAWYYPSSIGPSIGVVTRVGSEEGMAKNITYQINAILGLAFEDMKLLFSNYSLMPIVPYKGERFCLIPSTAAETLGVSLGDQVIVQGTKLRIAGIYNTSIISSDVLRSLRGTSISPIDPYFVGILGIGASVPLMSGQQPPPLSLSRIIVVPFDLAIELGGYVAEVSIVFPSGQIDRQRIVELSKDLANILDLSVYVGVEEKVFAFSRVSTFTAFGLEGIIVIVILGSLNAVAALIGIQRERIKDMQVYATLGLSPSGAILMSILESITYSVLGVFIGYFLGFAGNTIFRATGLLPPEYTPNYASLFMMLSLAVLLLASFASSLYPARLTSKIITPSLERKWKPPTKPKKGIWEMPLPLKMEIEEIKGLIIFLREYYLGMGAERPHYRIDAIKLFSIETDEPRLHLEVALAPYEAGVSESVDITVVRNVMEKSCSFRIILKKISGDEDIWVRGSYAFVDDLRTQLLLWRFLPSKDRARYIAKAEKEAQASP